MNVAQQIEKQKNLRAKYAAKVEAGDPRASYYQKMVEGTDRRIAQLESAA